METYYSAEEMRRLGLREYGDGVRISRNSSIYNPDRVSIGNNVRIDDFTILSGSVSLGSYIHISAYSALYGQNGIFMEDFSELAARVLVYSTSHDYSGEYMTNPMIPKEYKREIEGPVRLCRHALIGAGSIIMPGVTIGEGAAVGAMSLVTKDLDPWTIYWGIPCKAGKPRSKNALQLERQFMSNRDKG